MIASLFTNQTQAQAVADGGAAASDLVFLAKIGENSAPMVTTPAPVPKKPGRPPKMPGQPPLSAFAAASLAPVSKPASRQLCAVCTQPVADPTPPFYCADHAEPFLAEGVPKVLEVQSILSTSPRSVHQNNPPEINTQQTPGNQT